MLDIGSCVVSLVCLQNSELQTSYQAIDCTRILRYTIHNTCLTNGIAMNNKLIALFIVL